jgi:hypothetical protein
MLAGCLKGKALSYYHEFMTNSDNKEYSMDVDVDEGNVFGVMPLTTILLPVLRKLKNQKWGILAYQSVYLVICKLVMVVSMDARL